MGAERFAGRYPKVWHVIEAEGVSSAERDGLLSAAALRERAEMALSSVNRDDFERLILGNELVAVLRFQQMQDERLRPTLSGRYEGRPDLWRAMIDRHVFFWTTPERQDGFLRATWERRMRSHVPPLAGPPRILEFATAQLLRAHDGQAVYSPINSGSTMLGGARTKRRNEHLFRPIAEYAGGKIAELVIPGMVRLEEGLIGGAEL